MQSISIHAIRSNRADRKQFQYLQIVFSNKTRSLVLELTCWLVCSEFRQLCDKIGACRAISLKCLIGLSRLLKSNVNLKKKTDKNPPTTISIFYFLEVLLFTGKLSRTTAIHPGIFLLRPQWADSVSPRMNTIASHDQLGPIRIEENLVLNYNG